MEKGLKSDPLEIVERIVRNLPIQSHKFWYMDTEHGRMYFAAGLDSNNAYHGVWAFTEGPGIARTVEFKPNQYWSAVQKEMQEDCYQMLMSMAGKGMLDPEYFRQAQ